ncbi:MAG: hypothetical protein HZA94_02510 [Candidatus Vogelbacteria bacterium]|nr:hypothetical protein [Candidatus Vogelbacteria bacterium]
MLKESPEIIKKPVKPKDPLREQKKQKRAEDTVAIIEAMKIENDKNLLEKINREFKDADEVIRSIRSEKLRRTAIGLKQAAEEAKTSTEVKKFMDKLREITNKKPY